MVQPVSKTARHARIVSLIRERPVRSQGELGEMLAAEVLYGEQSAVWDQAENRLHAQKALLETLLADG